MQNNKLTDSLIIGIDFAKNKKDTVMIVGRKPPGRDPIIVNAFQGEDALALYDLLTTKEQRK